MSQPNTVTTRFANAILSIHHIAAFLNDDGPQNPQLNEVVMTQVRSELGHLFREEVRPPKKEDKKKKSENVQPPKEDKNKNPKGSKNKEVKQTKELKNPTPNNMFHSFDVMSYEQMFGIDNTKGTHVHFLMTLSDGWQALSHFLPRDRYVEFDEDDTTALENVLHTDTPYIASVLFGFSSVHHPWTNLHHGYLLTRDRIEKDSDNEDEKIEVKDEDLTSDLADSLGMGIRLIKNKGSKGNSRSLVLHPPPAIPALANFSNLIGKKSTKRRLLTAIRLDIQLDCFIVVKMTAKEKRTRPLKPRFWELKTKEEENNYLGSQFMQSMINSKRFTPLTKEERKNGMFYCRLPVPGKVLRKYLKETFLQPKLQELEDEEKKKDDEPKDALDLIEDEKKGMNGKDIEQLWDNDEPTSHPRDQKEEKKEEKKKSLLKKSRVKAIDSPRPPSNSDPNPTTYPAVDKALENIHRNARRNKRENPETEDPEVGNSSSSSSSSSSSAPLPTPPPTAPLPKRQKLQKEKICGPNCGTKHELCPCVLNKRQCINCECEAIVALGPSVEDAPIRID